MASQVLASPVAGVGGELLSVQAASSSRSPQPTDASPEHSKSHDPVAGNYKSHPDHSGKSPSAQSQTQSNHSENLSTQQHDQATFEQTQRAVGNLLDALRSNNAIGQSMSHATTHPSSTMSAPGPTQEQIKNSSVVSLESQLAQLSHVSSNDTSLNTHSINDHDVSDPQIIPSVEEEMPDNVQTAQDTGQISAFAKLEFDDGPFYITTYALELGRDARAYRAAKAKLAAQKALQNGQTSSSGRSDPSSKSKRDGGSQVKGSVVSDRGGFYGVDDLEGEKKEADEERQRQQADPSQSSAHSASSIVNPKDLYTRPPLPHFNYQAYPIDEYEREIEEIIDPGDDEQEGGFLLPIHHAPVKDDLQADVANHRSVSRRHAKIFWEDDCFNFSVKGVNGAFVDEVHYAKGSVVPLKGDVSIQIKGIKLQFKLPLHSSIESSEESDQVEDDSPNQNADSSPATSGVEASPNATNKTPLKVKIRNFKKTSPILPQTILGPDGKPKRRGPGRPPKDGIMSKRERLIKERADREAAAKAANGGVTPEPSSTRGKSGRLSSKVEVEESKPAKRKYNKRKSTNQDADDVTPKAEDDTDGAVDDAPPTKRARVARSESPEYPKMEDLTEKDLQRPPYNYSILIYDLLKDSTKPLDLKGIYRGLKLKWPHFLYRYKDAKGWESSVRHNVNEDKLKIIEKVDRVGKGYSYRAKPGVDIDQHKKKRARSPPAAQKASVPQQPRYQQPTHPPPPGPYNYPRNQQPPPNHGMYGHLVPTIVPQGSVPYPPPYPHGPNGPPPHSMIPHPHPAAPGASHQPLAGPAPNAPSAAGVPPYPAANPKGPAIPNHPSGSYIPHQQAAGLAAIPPKPFTTVPPPPPGVSPFDPFLPSGLAVIATFEKSMLDSMTQPSEHSAMQAALVSVRKRVFEGESISSQPGGETAIEGTMLHYFKGILENDTFNNPGFVGWDAVRRERERLSLHAQNQGGPGSGNAAQAVPAGKKDPVAVPSEAGVKTSTKADDEVKDQLRKVKGENEAD